VAEKTAGESRTRVTTPPQQPFSLFAEDNSFNGPYSEDGMFDRMQQVTQKMGRDLVDSGVMSAPLIKPSRLSV
jgi:hypothetical protein